MKPYLLVFLIVILGCAKDDPLATWKLTHSLEFGRQPLWSTDGSKVLFGDDSPGSAGLWTWSPGSDPVLIANSPPHHSWDYSWSPNSEEIAFTSPGEPDSNNTGIWVVSLSDGTLRHILGEGKYAGWFDSGASIVVELPETDLRPGGIYRVGTQSGEKEFLTRGVSPKCSPSGNRISFLDRIIDGQLQIYQDSNSIPISDRGIVQWTWTANEEHIYWIDSDYTIGRLSGKLFRFTFPDSTLLIKTSVSHPAPDKNGDHVAYIRISQGLWDGMCVHNFEFGEDVVADNFLNPHFSPTDERIAGNAPTGGIIIYSKEI